LVQITRAARLQYHAIAAYYLDPVRLWITAAENLDSAFRDAVESISQSPLEGIAHPPRYPRLKSNGTLWCRHAIYWISFVSSGRNGQPVITNIVNHRLLDGTISADEEPMDDA
jgi:hypothetical protein